MMQKGYCTLKYYGSYLCNGEEAGKTDLEAPATCGYRVIGGNAPHKTGEEEDWWYRTLGWVIKRADV
jgi:hypothetical protein